MTLMPLSAAKKESPPLAEVLKIFEPFDKPEKDRSSSRNSKKETNHLF